MRRSTALLLSGALILVSGTAVPTLAADDAPSPDRTEPAPQSESASLDGSSGPAGNSGGPADAQVGETAAEEQVSPPSGPEGGEPPQPVEAVESDTGAAERSSKAPDEPRGDPEKDGSKSASTRAARRASTAVTIVYFDYEPKTATVSAGDTVTWTNRDSAPHTATDQGEFDTGRLDKGESGSVTFDEPGTFNYICTFHPEMKGTVVVRSSGGGSGSTGTSSAEASSGVGSDGAAATGASSADGTTGGSTNASRGGGSLPATGRNELPLILIGSALLVLGLLSRAWDEHRAWR